MKARSLELELLEDRTAPATFGIPWQNPTHLTLSFAPDGTTIAGHQSELFRALDPQFSSTAFWQREVVRAFQTWAAYANISVGLHEDSGAPFGVAGPMQGDPRFGDIRIGAHIMSSEVLSISVPPDPYLAGTLAGDVFLNSSVTFNQHNLFPVLLHEAGHVFGLDDSDDPASPMYPHFDERHTQLTESDSVALQGLYGVRAPDRNQPNGSFATATEVRHPGIVPIYLGTTPLVAYGDRTTLQDVDYFRVRPIALYSGPVTFQLQTAGISFLAPRLSIYDQYHHLLGQAASSSVFGDIVSVRLPHINPLAQRYYAKIDSPASDVFGIGRYALTITFDDRLLIAPDSIPALVRGPYDSVTNEDIAALFSNPSNVFFNDDLHTNNSFLTAEVLQSTPGYPRDTRYEKIASLTPDDDVDVYRIRASQFRPEEAHVLTVTLLQMEVNGVLPIVTVYDEDARPLTTDTLLNGNGTYTIQAAEVMPGGRYYLKVTPARPGDAGNYMLVVDFRGVTANLETFASGTLDQSRPSNNYTLYVAESQLFQFTLSAGTQGLPQDARVRMEIYNSAGDLVFSLTGDAGQTVSDSSVLLTPGQYRVRFSVESTSTNPVPAVPYLLRGIGLSDPIGPALVDPTYQPMYRCEDDPSMYCYPGSIMSDRSFLWVSDDNGRR